MSPRLLAGRAPALLLDPVVRVLVAAGISPAMVTTAGLIGNLIAAVLIGACQWSEVAMITASKDFSLSSSFR